MTILNNIIFAFGTISVLVVLASVSWVLFLAVRKAFRSIRMTHQMIQWIRGDAESEWNKTTFFNKILQAVSTWGSLCFKDWDQVTVHRSNGQQKTFQLNS